MATYNKLQTIHEMRYVHTYNTEQHMITIKVIIYRLIYWLKERHLLQLTENPDSIQNGPLISHLFILVCVVILQRSTPSLTLSRPLSNELHLHRYNLSSVCPHLFATLTQTCPLQTTAEKSLMALWSKASQWH